MNCKQGDLARVVVSVRGNYGKIVRCVKYIGRYTYIHDQETRFDCWKIEPKLPTDVGEYTDIVSDSFLRPIRGQDGEDEMLRIARKPERMTA